MTAIEDLDEKLELSRVKDYFRKLRSGREVHVGPHMRGMTDDEHAEANGLPANAQTMYWHYRAAQLDHRSSMNMALRHMGRRVQPTALSGEDVMGESIDNLVLKLAASHDYQSHRGGKSVTVHAKAMPPHGPFGRDSFLKSMFGSDPARPSKVKIGAEAKKQGLTAKDFSKPGVMNLGGGYHQDLGSGQRVIHPEHGKVGSVKAVSSSKGEDGLSFRATHHDGTTSDHFSRGLAASAVANKHHADLNKKSADPKLGAESGAISKAADDASKKANASGDPEDHMAAYRAHLKASSRTDIIGAKDGSLFEHHEKAAVAHHKKARPHP